MGRSSCGLFLWGEKEVLTIGAGVAAERWENLENGLDTTQMGVVHCKWYVFGAKYVNV